MHLDHKIPWNTVSSHFALVRSNPHYTPRRTDLFPRNLPSQTNDLKHFARVLVNTIRVFSTTERAKYAVDMHATPLAEQGKLFSDELLTYPERKFGLGQHRENSAQHNPLSAEYQRVDYWVSRGYTNSDGDLADAVKMLIIIAASASGDGPPEDARKLEREAMSALIRLSQHPKIPLRHLNSLSWGHSFGVKLLAAFALKVYLLINIVDAVLARQRYTKAAETMDGNVSLLELDSFDSFARSALADYDYPAQNIPHRAFWHTLGVNKAWADRNAETKRLHQHASVFTLTQDQGVTDPLAHREGVTAEVRTGLKEYLKMCFGLMYRYDLLLREWYGEEVADQWWEEEVRLSGA